MDRTASLAAADLPAAKRRETPLETEVRRIVGPAMGVRFVPDRWDSHLKTWHYVAGLFLTTALLWLAVWRWTDDFEPKLATLIAWGACYFAFACYLARATSTSIYETIARDILPYASDRYCNAVAAELRARFTVSIRILLPIAIGVASLAAGWWALDYDLCDGECPDGVPVTPERVLWAVCFFVYFLTAGFAVVAARFYLPFSRHLDLDRSRFSVLRAADSPIVRGLSRLGTRVLIFWALIFLDIVSSMLLAFAPPEFRIDPTSRLLFTMVPIAGFFSIGFGTLMYLASEANIRATLQRFANETAASFQERGNDALRRAEEDPAAWDEAKRLADLQGQVIAGARYGSPVGVTVSVVLPLLMPILSLTLNLLLK